MRLALVRHPLPAIAAGLCYGSTDLPLASGALQQCLPQVEAVLLGKIPADAMLWSSPLQRAAHFAQALALARGQVIVQYDVRLAEMDFGSWEMCHWDDIARAEIDAWADNVLDYAPGGAETVLQMTQRVLGFIQHLRESPLASSGAIVVCHAGVMRIVRAYQASLNLREIGLLAAQDMRKIAYGEVVWKEI